MLGIKNLGNTCFLNAVLQSLTSIRSFHVFLKQNDGPNTPLLKNLRESLRALSKPASCLLDTTYLTNMAPLQKHFATKEQQDAQELLQSLMTALDEEVQKQNSRFRFVSTLNPDTTRPKNPCADKFKRNPFLGLVASKVSCQGCGKKSSVQVQKFHDLSLAIPNVELYLNGRVTSLSCTLEDCLRLFTATELLQDVECSNCTRANRGRALAKKSLSLGRPPRALCLHIRRLVGNLHMNKLVKIPAFIEFPLLLDVSPFFSFEDGRDTKINYNNENNSIFVGAKGGSTIALDAVNKEIASLGRSVLQPKSNMTKNEADSQSDHCYALKAVVVHHGSAYAGHFTAFRKLSVERDQEYDEFVAKTMREMGCDLELPSTSSYTQHSQTCDNKWVHISDEKWDYVDAEEVLHSQAYMLFYERLSPGDNTTTFPLSRSLPKSNGSLSLADLISSQ